MIIDMHGHLGRINLHPRWDADAKRLETLRQEAGFDYLAVSSADAIMYDTRRGNREVVQAVRKNPHLLGYIVVNPLFPETLNDLASLAKHDRLIGVKLHPDYHGYDVRGRKSHDCLARILEATDLVLCHCSCMPGTSFAGIGSLLEVAARYPQKKFIVAHMAGIFQNGAYPYFPNLSGVEQVADSGLTNVWVDTAHYLVYVYPEVMEEALSYLPAERFVFGTDVPLQGSAQMRYTRDAIRTPGIPRQGQDLILFRNALTLLGAKAPRSRRRQALAR
ncbi:MAG: hypothetical protein A3K19_32310 [Lentisphaerae bacterium RIFOXYB12_FULL_65_16]|nr:MAG: hypothetical protein A3K18_12680 [Lentisphaerae bacterium RIFOXYA12_64_32]OGV85695.1 MAG: hypothetical protein A3K19_32310 [Lentisphaerae bacterium RIFOXYB12_FULL_65_16]